MLNTATNFTSPTVPSGGFMDPAKIAGGFGLTEGMRAADFGSGSGYFTILMAKMVGEDGLITAVDVLNSALDTLRAKAKSEGLANINTTRSNLEILGSSGLADGSQDLVLLANVLFQSNDKNKMLDEATRVLKSGGTLIVIDWRRGSNGFGPPDHLKIDQQEMADMLTGKSLRLTSEIDAGPFHFGLKFIKP